MWVSLFSLSFPQLYFPYEIFVRLSILSILISTFLSPGRAYHTVYQRTFPNNYKMDLPKIRERKKSLFYLYPQNIVATRGFCFVYTPGNFLILIKYVSHYIVHINGLGISQRFLVKYVGFNFDRNVYFYKKKKNTEIVSQDRRGSREKLVFADSPSPS